LLSALGLAKVACGGAFKGTEEGGEAGTTVGGQATGGTKAAGGTNTGGTKASGGSISLAGQATGGSSTGASGGTATAGAFGFSCDDPRVVAAGYEQCGVNGLIHRVKVVECASPLPRPSGDVPVPPPDQCTADTDCVAQPHGYCSSTVPSTPGYCEYGCVKDQECLAGQICFCGDPVGRCVAAACASDADCGGNLLCRSYDSSGGCGAITFTCQTSQDTCGSDADCSSGAHCLPFDATSSPSSFTCRPGGCVIGRPFLVEDQVRVAPVETRVDWLHACELELAGVPATVRQAAARAWAGIGQMEHASVAAFARFALQLLSLGAPPELIELTTRAMADETRHARLAFGVASALGGEALGPAALDVDGSLLETSLADVVRLVVREGCIGETCAALEAREAALLAQDPSLARLLDGVADDESRHAELAWRFVSWALEQAPAEVAAVLRSELDTARPAAPGASAHELAVSAFGILPQRLRHELQAAAFDEVIGPCAAGLLRRADRNTLENQVLSA
jgi:hypothetical protein